MKKKLGTAVSRTPEMILLGAGCASIRTGRASPTRVPVAEGVESQGDLSSIAPLPAAAARFEVDKSLSEDDEARRQSDIDRRYSIGQQLSDEDAESIRITATPSEFTGRWSARWTATGSAPVSSITATEHVRVHGLIGGSGVGLAYAADPSGTVRGRVDHFARADTFTAYGAYSTMDYDATFSMSTGSFNVTGT